MDGSKVLAPILAGMGIGWLAFSPDGQKLAKGLGQSIIPALTQGGGENGQQQNSPDSEQKALEDKEKKSEKKEDDE